MTSPIPTATGHHPQTEPIPQLWIARDADGTCDIYSERPEYGETKWLAPNGADKHLVGMLFTGDCKEWPETWIPKGPTGLKRLNLADLDAVATSALTGDASSPGMAPETT